VSPAPSHRFERGLAGPGAIGAVLAWWVRSRALSPAGTIGIGAELPYVGRDPAGAVKLSIFAGALTGPLEACATRGKIRWVQADSWRTASFRKGWWSSQAKARGMAASRKSAEKRGIPFMPKRVAAKAEAQMCVAPRLPGLLDLAEKVGGGAEHALDAGGIMLWRAGQPL
jgi:hypothetical protein